MTTDMERSSIILSSSLRQCRPAQFSLHFRGELPEFNILASNYSGPNPVALRFRCKNVLSRKSTSTSDVIKQQFSSVWKIRHAEMRSRGRIGVPIVYDGDWDRCALISLVMVVYNKKSQRLAYSRGEIVLVDDLIEDRLFTILLSPRNERASEDLKVPVIIHLMLDVWDADGSASQMVRSGLSAIGDRSVNGHDRLMYERVETVSSPSDECLYPESTDFLIEVALPNDDDDDEEKPCDCDNCFEDTSTIDSIDSSEKSYTKIDSKFDENANLVVVSRENSPPPHTKSIDRKPPMSRCVQFFCHQSKLAGESFVFEEMFRQEWTKDANVLRLRTFRPEAVEMFLNFLYSSQLRPTDETLDSTDGDARISFEEILVIVSLAKRFEVERLREYCDSLLTDRYLNLERAGEIVLLAERYELPLLGQAAMSLLSWSLDEEYWRQLIEVEDGKHLLSEIVRESRRKHMFTNVINPVSPY